MNSGMPPVVHVIVAVNIFNIHVVVVIPADWPSGIVSKPIAAVLEAVIPADKLRAAHAERVVVAETGAIVVVRDAPIVVAIIPVAMVSVVPVAAVAVVVGNCLWLLTLRLRLALLLLGALRLSLVLRLLGVLRLRLAL